MNLDDEARYFLAIDVRGLRDHWTEVTREQFMEAEKACCFTSKFPGHPATAGFSAYGLRGRVLYKSNQKSSGAE